MNTRFTSIILAILTSQLFAGRLRAAITVTTLADNGPGSLRAAIALAAAGDTIEFAVAGNILLTGGELVITTDLVIQGPDARRLTVSASGLSRVFHIYAGRVRISGLTIADGAVSGANGADGALPDGGGGEGETVRGGGVYNRGHLTLIDCVLRGHRAAGGGGGAGSARSAPSLAGSGGRGGAAFGGAIYNENSLELFNCSLMDNESGGGKGGHGGVGVGSRAGGTGGLAGIARGGALFCARDAECEVVLCTFARNQTTGGPGGDGGYGALLGGDGGDGDRAEGGALAAEGMCRLRSCTFSANASTPGAGGAGGNSINATGATGRTGAARGGGLFAAFRHLIDPVRIELRNTLIAGNLAPVGPDVYEETGSSPAGFLSTGANLIGIGDGVSGWSATDLVGSSSGPIDARLGALHENGAATPTMAPARGSRARDAGREFGLSTDQRGALRALDLPSISNLNSAAGPDIGACEAGAGLRILSLSPSNAGMQIHFQSEAGVQCQLERQEMLNAGNWQAFGSPILGTGDVMSRFDLEPLPAIRFYRLVAMP